MSITAIDEPQVVDITINKGNSFNRTLEFEDDDGTPTKLSGFDGAAYVLDEETGEILATFTIPALSDDGKIPLLLKVSDTEDLDVGTYKWALTLLGKGNPDVSTTTVIVGDAEVKKVALAVA